MRMSTPVKTIQDAIGIHQEGHRIGYDAGLRAGLAKLDQAWAEIDVLGGDLGKPDSYTDGFAHAISMALAIIEKLGGLGRKEKEK